MEQKIEEVEADISQAEAKAEKAETDGNAEELRYWRQEELQLRDNKLQLMGEKGHLRDEKARKEVLQQGSTLCLPLECCCHFHGGAPPYKTFRPGSIMILSCCGED